MQLSDQPSAIIWRHRKENLKKCSLRGLESRADLAFFTYPNQIPGPLNQAVMLSMDGPPLSLADAGRPIFLIDGTWRYAQKMAAQVPVSIEQRSLPQDYMTAYPRRQADCTEPDRGLASVEALYLAFLLTGRDPKGLLDHYHWSELFLQKNDLAGESKNPLYCSPNYDEATNA